MKSHQVYLAPHKRTIRDLLWIQAKLLRKTKIIKNNQMKLYHQVNKEAKKKAAVV